MSSSNSATSSGSASICRGRGWSCTSRAPTRRGGPQPDRRSRCSPSTPGHSPRRRTGSVAGRPRRGRLPPRPRQRRVRRTPAQPGRTFCGDGEVDNELGHSAHRPLDVGTREGSSSPRAAPAARPLPCASHRTVDDDHLVVDVPGVRRAERRVVDALDAVLREDALDVHTEWRRRRQLRIGPT